MAFVICLLGSVSFLRCGGKNVGGVFTVELDSIEIGQARHLILSLDDICLLCHSGHYFEKIVFIYSDTEKAEELTDLIKKHAPRLLEIGYIELIKAPDGRFD